MFNNSNNSSSTSNSSSLATVISPALEQEGNADAFSREPDKKRMQRLDHLDGIRALSALYVVFVHAYMTVWNSNFARHPRGLWSLMEQWLPSGGDAVASFIVVSGFCLMLPIVSQGEPRPLRTRQFFLRRARRILPPYYLAMLLSLALIAMWIGKPTETVWDIAIPVSRASVISHILMIHNITGHSSDINYPFWSIAVECQIYLLFPLLLWLFWKWGPQRTVALAVAGSYALAVAIRHTKYSGLRPHFVGLFALGMLAATAAFGSHKSGRFIRQRSEAIFGGAAMLLLANLLIGGLEGPYFVWRYNDFLLLPVGIFAAAVALRATVCSESAMCRFLSWRPLAAIGMFSYSLYLIHAPLLQVIWQYGIKPLALGDMTAWGMLVIFGIAVITGISYLFFLVCERPFMSHRVALHG